MDVLILLTFLVYVVLLFLWDRLFVLYCRFDIYDKFMFP